jgi:hypothetical protein
MKRIVLLAAVFVLVNCTALGFKPDPTDTAKAYYTALNAQDPTAVTQLYLPDQQSTMSTIGAATNLSTLGLLLANVFGAETEQLIHSVQNSPFSYSNLEYSVEVQKGNTALVKIKGNVTVNVYDTTVPYCDYVDLAYDEKDAKWYIDGLTEAKKIRFESMIQKKSAKAAELALKVGVSLLTGSSLTDPSTVKMILPYLFDQCPNPSEK